MVFTIGALTLNSPNIVSPIFRHRYGFAPPPQFPFHSNSTFNLHNNFTHFSRIPIKASNQVSNDDGFSEKKLGLGKSFDLSRNLLKFGSDNFLPLALLGGVVFGLVNPTPGCVADRYYLSRVGTFGIFLISGLTLHSDEIGAAAEAWPVGLFGLVSILLLTPFLSKIIMLIRLQPQEFVTGLAIFSCMPTTLSSGVALTRLAGGNSALALAMTVISSLLGILIVPFSISKFIATGAGVSVPAEQLFRNLVLSLLVPLILGKVLRESFKGVLLAHLSSPLVSLSGTGLASVVDQNRKLLSIISAILLSLVPWIQVSKSRSLLLSVKPAIFLVAVAMGALLHVTLLAFNALSIQLLSAVTGGKKSAFAQRDNAIALLLVASQKTLPVMVAVVDQLGGAFGESGLLVLPCVAAHLNQIIIDSFLVGFWHKKEPEFHDAKAA